MTEYWYNFDKKEVEEGPQSDWRHLLGPYATREEAEQALEKARRRTEEWDEEERRLREE